MDDGREFGGAEGHHYGFSLASTARFSTSYSGLRMRESAYFESGEQMQADFGTWIINDGIKRTHPRYRKMRLFAIKAVVSFASHGD